MDVEEEFVLYARDIVPEGNNKSRDLNLVCYYYGFGDSAWPTLDFTATKFGIGSRQGVQQLLDKKFRDRASLGSLPVLSACGELLASQPIWVMSEYVEALAAGKLAGRDISVRGLLRLMQELGTCLDYDLYDARFDKLTREEIEDTANGFIAADGRTKPIRKALQKARTRPGALGMANTGTLVDLVGPEDIPILKAALSLDPSIWKKSAGDEFWYCLEDRSNTLVGFAEKAFTLADAIDIDRLATCLANALKWQASPYAYPDAPLIREYIRSSRYFRCAGDEASFLGERGQLTDAQTAVVRFFASRAKATLPELRNHLLEAGFSRPLATKTIVTSPIVFKDQSAGHGRFTYALIVDPHAARPTPAADQGRYEVFRARMQALEEAGTDASVQAKRRREQPVLQEWLFGQGSTETCALCGHEFGVAALVTAHKKRRAECNTAERLDPYIVMPLCLFGCDYMYERGLIYVDAGTVRISTTVAATPGEIGAARRLEGRRLDPRWLLGPQGYFE